MMQKQCVYCMSEALQFQSDNTFFKIWKLFLHALKISALYKIFTMKTQDCSFPCQQVEENMNWKDAKPELLQRLRGQNV